MGSTSRLRVVAVMLAAFVVAMAAAALTPTQALAGEGWRSYVDRWWDESSHSVRSESKSAYCRDIVAGDDATIDSGWYITAEDDDDIDTIFIKGGATVNIIVTDGTTQLCEGIHVPADSTLNIYGQSAGSGWLRSNEDENCYAGIGGMDGDDGNANCGTINIHGGNIYAKGDDDSSGSTEGGAGIGGGYKGSGGRVVIYGGSVEAVGNSNAAGIGGGDKGSGDTVIIYGGSVTATGGSSTLNGGAGIGGGNDCSGGNVRIYGGTVTAKGGCDGAGIGGGDDAGGGDIEIHGSTVEAVGNNGAGIGGGQYGTGGYIKIRGGNVTAKSKDDGAGIGGGEERSGGRIEITGGTVSAEGEEAAGIGGGRLGDNEQVTITSPANIIKAKGGDNAAGIGGGYNGACGTVVINGGTVNAQGGSISNGGGAGIGGGNGNGGGVINISNADVTATGGSDGAGIGGGDQGNGGSITIAGDVSHTVNATGGGYAAGIGGGQNGSGVSVTIRGCTVNATGATDAAGIGGGEKGSGGEVTITGGKVTAKGSPRNESYEGGAGIGGGESGAGATVTITGGEVEATGGVDAAGIGGGDQGRGGKVTISGGTVTANGGKCGSGIGGGDADRSGATSHGDGGEVIITGGKVTATGGEYAAGIGSGEEGLSGGTVVIGVENDTSAGPTVIANGGRLAAGIGGGDAYVAGGNHSTYVEPKGANVTIYSGNVTATGGEDGAGIGGGEGCSNASTKIYGGTVVANAGQTGDNDGGAGIGSGDDALVGDRDRPRHTSGGTIEIHGGNVTAAGGNDGAGIGGGDYGSGGNITISGGTVNASGGRFGAGIGGGQARGAGKVTITGGYVRANGGSSDDADEPYGGAGIGGGSNEGATATESANDYGAAEGAGIGVDVISISGNTTVTATGGIEAAGIGGGAGGYASSVTIAVDEGCKVDAQGGKHAAGIGGGTGNSDHGGLSGKITINSGTVTATGGDDGGSGIGTGAACKDPGGAANTVDVTVNAGIVTAKAGEMKEVGRYDSGAAIGTGGQYLKDELNDIEISDDFVIKDVDVPSIFRGTIKLNGGRVVAIAAAASDEVDEYLNGALTAIGTTRTSNLKSGTVEFNGSYTWMWNGGFTNDTGAKTFSQSVMASANSISFRDNPDYQHVWYVETPEYGEDIEDSEIINTAGASDRVPALTKYDKGENNYGLVVVEPQHEHTFSYTAEGDTITASCSKETCPLAGHKTTLKIIKPLHAKYDDGLDGKALEATIEDPNFIRGSAEVEYYRANAEGTAPVGNKLDEAPYSAGTYWAQITLGTGANRATAHVVYTIAKAENPARITANAGITMPVGEEGPFFVDLANNVKLNGYEPGDMEITYEIVGDANGCGMVDVLAPSVMYASDTTVPGKPVIVNVTVPGDDNYESTQGTITVTISSKPRRTVTADDVEATYGDDGPYIVLASVEPAGSSDVYTYEVKYGYEDYIDVDETTGFLTIKKAGEAYVIVTVNETADYAPSSAEAKVTIKPAQAKISATSETIDRGGTPVGGYEVEGLIGEDVLTTPPTMTYKSGDDVVNPTTAAPGTYTVEPSGADANGSYTFTYVPAELKVREPSPVTVAPTDFVMVDGNSTNLADNVAMNGATGAVHFAIAGDTLGCELAEDGTLTSGLDSGTIVVNVTVDADDNYSALTATPIVVTVAEKDPQEIEAPEVHVTYGDADKVVSAQVVDPATGGGTITFSVKSGSGDYIDVDPTTGALKIKAVPADGTAYVVATAAETKTHKETSVDVPIIISKAHATIKAINQVGYVGDVVPSLSDPVVGTHYEVIGLVNGDEPDVVTVAPKLTYQKGGVPTLPATIMVDTYDIVPSDAQMNGNYTVGYENAILQIKDRKRQTVTASDMIMTYGESARSIGATTDGDGALSYSVMGDVVTVDEYGTLSAKKAGTAYVTITAAGTDDYKPASKEIRVTVYRAQLTVIAKDEQIYMGETPAGYYDVVGLIGDDTLTEPPVMSYQKDGVEVDVTTAPAGDYDIVPSGANSDGRYTVTFVNGKLSIRGDQAVVASDMTVTYGDTDVFVRATTTGEGELSYAVKPGSEPLIDVDAQTGEVTIKRAGIATVTVTAAGTDSAAPALKDVKITIERKKASIVADEKFFDNTYPYDPSVLTARTFGTVNGDELAYTLDCEPGTMDNGTSSPVRVIVDPYIYPNYNYEITTKEGKIAFTSLQIDVSSSGWSGVYDGQSHGISLDVTGSASALWTKSYGTVEGTYDLSSSPTLTDAGTLTVYYEVNAGDNGTIHGFETIEVKKVSITPQVLIDSWNWGEEPNAPRLSEGSNPGGATVAYEYASKGSEEWTAEPPSAIGDYTVRATVPETKNHFGGTATADFSISAGERKDPEPAPAATKVMYRLYNPNSGEHFYTGNTHERDEVAASGWTYEGVSWVAPVTSTTPVYRLYSGTDHHYTTSAHERDRVVAAGWTYEGIGWYSAAALPPVQPVCGALGRAQQLGQSQLHCRPERGRPLGVVGLDARGRRLVWREVVSSAAIR